jgi:predicted flavoprotein YhiN
VIGGGAAGFFGAIASAKANPHAQVILLEASRQPLAKVRISGGGRCNVTHACFDPSLLVQNYPRGGKALRGAFTRFQAKDTVAWFALQGVQLKTEADGRMFPITDSSETIVDCLMNAAQYAGVEICTGTHVVSVKRKPPLAPPQARGEEEIPQARGNEEENLSQATGEEEGLSQIREEEFEILLKSGEVLQCDRLLLATGSSPVGYKVAQELGHSIEPPVPSLFTFNIRDEKLRELAGVSVNSVRLRLSCDGKNPIEQTGPLLITHWGLSGPAVLKLSAWGARVLHDSRYQGTLSVNWQPNLNQEEVRQKLLAVKNEWARKAIALHRGVDLPHRLWQYIIARVGINYEDRWAGLTNKALNLLVQELSQGQYLIAGKGVFKEEFVTCGGVNLKEVNFKTMESRLIPGLYFAGEILDIDGVTGGFNFQSAWTTAYLAGIAMATNK